MIPGKQAIMRRRNALDDSLTATPEARPLPLRWPPAPGRCPHRSMPSSIPSASGWSTSSRKEEDPSAWTSSWRRSPNSASNGATSTRCSPAERHPQGTSCLPCCARAGVAHPQATPPPGPRPDSDLPPPPGTRDRGRPPARNRFAPPCRSWPLKGPSGLGSMLRRPSTSAAASLSTVAGPGRNVVGDSGTIRWARARSRLG